MPIQQEEVSDLEAATRERVRTLRTERGWSLDALATRSGINASTLSRIETGGRRISLDHLVAIARAFDVPIDALVAVEPDAAVIHPEREVIDGVTIWRLTRPDDVSGRTVAKMRFPASRRLPEPRVHPGREWVYVLSGTLRLQLGGREILVKAGQAIEFSTTVHHASSGYKGAVELLIIFDRDGDDAHLRDHTHSHT